MKETTAVRLDQNQRDWLDETAPRFHNTPSGLIRLAVDQLIIATKANGGQLPPSVLAAAHQGSSLALAGGAQ